MAVYRRVDEGRIDKQIEFGVLVQGKRPRGRCKLRFKDVNKRDLVAMGLELIRGRHSSAIEPRGGCPEAQE